MLTHFICPPDKEQCRVEDCLNKCRLGQRCLPYPYLAAVSATRDYKCKVSASQAGNGVRYMYLNITTPHAAEPAEMAFTTLGTSHHTLMEGFQGPGQNGFFMENDFMSGTFDYFDPIEGVLWDFKTYKIYKVKKVKGIVMKWEPDPSGEVYSRGGKTKTGREYKKGDPKLIQVRTEDPSQCDYDNEALQINAYRILAKEHGIDVKSMRLCMTVKDYMQDCGLEPIEIVELPFIDDEIVLNWFREKTEALNHHLVEGTLPPICTDKERWNGRRCKDYCKFNYICEMELRPDEELF